MAPRRHRLLFACFVSFVACRPAPPAGDTTKTATPEARVETRQSEPLTLASASPAPAAPAISSVAPAPPSPEAYPWLADKSCAAPPVVSTLEARFPAPAGFTRVPLEPASFGAFLRGLPMAATDAPVLTYQNKVLHPATHANVAGVVAIDQGTADLQQCADSVIRLHAEWRYAKGLRDHSYRAAAGMEIPYARWRKGERPVAKGASLEWAGGSTSKGASEHEDFRKYLSSVFMFANTGSLAVQAKPTPVEMLAPGDFVVLPGSPGHAVLVLDVVTAPDGKKRALLGQGFMPAQSFHVLKAGAGESPWYVIDPSAPLSTPFWDPFPWSSLRRFQ